MLYREHEPVLLRSDSQVMRLLIHLATNRQRPVPKQEIDDLIWPGENRKSVAGRRKQLYQQLRRALDEKPRTPPAYVRYEGQTGHFLWVKVPVPADHGCGPSEGAVESSTITDLPRDALYDQTYLKYRTAVVPAIDSPELIAHLEARYSCEAFRLAGKALPVTVLWQNPGLLSPDAILGHFDDIPPTPLQASAIFGPSEYVQARQFIKREFERGPIKYEGVNYCMRKININNNPPTIDGEYGLYYDNILTQYAMEWELKKALQAHGYAALKRISRTGSLPLRESVEAKCNPLINGAGRCAAMTVSTLIVFKRRDRFYCLIRRRSKEVGVSPGMLHVVPAGMFEAKNLEDPWSVTMNVWRELLEEVYDEKEQQGSGEAEFEDYILRKHPINIIIDMIKSGRAELSVTGICCDLLNLRTEVCTVLFVDDPAFSEARLMPLNWEYMKEGPAGKFAVRWEQIDGVIENEGAAGGIVASGAVCLGLGRSWVARRHSI
jgi:hypothetical protein